MVTGITALEVPHYGSGFEPQVAAAGSISKLTGPQPTIPGQHSSSTTV